MRQKWQNPAPLTINLAFDVDLLEAINEPDSLPKQLTATKNKIHINTYQQSNKGLKSSFGSISKNKKSSKKTLILEQEKIRPQKPEYGYISNEKRMIIQYRGSPDNKISQETTNKFKIEKKKSRKSCQSLSENHKNIENFKMTKTSSAFFTKLNENIWFECLPKKNILNSTSGKDSDKKYNIVQNLEQKNNRNLIINIRKNLLMATVSGENQQQIKNVYEAINRKLKGNNNKNIRQKSKSYTNSQYSKNRQHFYKPVQGKNTLHIQRK